MKYFRCKKMLGKRHNKAYIYEYKLSGEKMMKSLDTVALVLVIVGGLNWLLVGLFQYNLVDSLFGVDSVLSRVVYVLVGLAALWMLWNVLAHRSARTA